MNDLQKELQELKAKVVELESRIVAEPVKWHPKGGYWQVDCEGDVVAVDSFSHQKEFGTKRITKEQAKRAAIEMRKFNRLLALRDELCGDDAGLGIYHVIFQNRDGTYFIGYSEQQNNEIGSVRFTTKEFAQRACDMLNSGEVKL
jgi:hypothetical protein